MSTSDNNFNWDPLTHYLTTVGVHLLGGIVGPFVAPLNKGIIYYDINDQRLKGSENGGAPVNILTGGGGGSAYEFIQNNGTTQPQENTANFIPGSGISIAMADVAGVKTNITISATGGSGTVTSVAMTGDGTVFNSAVTGSPITTSGTLAPSLHTQSANTVLAGPTSGGAVVPTFRALVSTDIPLISLTTGVTGVLPIANGGTNATTANNALNNLLPSQTGQSGNFLTTNGTNTSWAAAGGGGGSIGGSGTADQMAYFTAATNITSSSAFIVDPTHGRLLLANTGGAGVIGALIVTNNATSNPDIRLVNTDTVGGGNTAIAWEVGANEGVSVQNAAITYQGFTTLDIQNSNNGPITFDTNAVQRMSLTGDGALSLVGLASAPAVSAANHATIYYDTTLGVVRVSKNGGAYATLI